MSTDTVVGLHPAEKLQITERLSFSSLFKIHTKVGIIAHLRNYTLQKLVDLEYPLYTV